MSYFKDRSRKIFVLALAWIFHAGRAEAAAKLDETRQSLILERF